jgi:hypothetical protein
MDGNWTVQGLTTIFLEFPYTALMSMAKYSIVDFKRLI